MNSVPNGFSHIVLSSIIRKLTARRRTFVQCTYASSNRHCSQATQLKASRKTTWKMTRPSLLGSQTKKDLQIVPKQVAAFATIQATAVKVNTQLFFI